MLQHGMGDLFKINPLRQCCEAGEDHGIEPEFQVDRLALEAMQVVMPAGSATAGCHQFKKISIVKGICVHVKNNRSCPFGSEFQKIVEGTNAFQVIRLASLGDIVWRIQVPMFS